MKNLYKSIIAIVLFAWSASSEAQSINWANMREGHRHTINANIGWDYASTVGLGYMYKFNMKVPVVANAQFSVPAGKTIGDDFKSKLGFQFRPVKVGNFQATVGVYGIFRQYQSEMARLQDFGSEFTGLAGYYRKHWYLAGEFGFDKAITTHINGKLAKKSYPATQDGWYVPTGGNFHFGIQVGYSISNLDIYMATGKITYQNFNYSAIVPNYVQIGLNVHL